ncbi:MAG: NADH-quinone oxidoreductase subunit J [Gammaproteobacteria bacterium]|nr:NADH-quinone oxidoreductase subunit J [Gammaproteobacteria bacterium]
MTFLQFAFYCFAAVLVFAAAGVVTVRNPVKAALFLVLAFFSAACVWITLEAEFLAIVLVLVYVGAVMVLFLFVVMMLDIDLAELRAGFARYLPVGSVVAVLLVVEIALVLARTFSPERFANPPPQAAGHSNTRELGEQLYTVYIYPFEIAAFILLVAIVAAIALTMRARQRPDAKRIDPAAQVRTRREQRLRIVQMKPEGRSGARASESPELQESPQHPEAPQPESPSPSSPPSQSTESSPS